MFSSYRENFWKKSSHSSLSILTWVTADFTHHAISTPRLLIMISNIPPSKNRLPSILNHPPDAIFSSSSMLSCSISRLVNSDTSSGRLGGINPTRSKISRATAKRVDGGV